MKEKKREEKRTKRKIKRTQQMNRSRHSCCAKMVKNYGETFTQIDV